MKIRISNSVAICMAILLADAVIVATVWTTIVYGGDEMNGELRMLLGRWQVVSLNFAALLICFGIFFSWRTVAALCQPVARKTWWTFAALIFGGVVLVGFNAPRTNRIYFDEQIYENIAQTIAWTGEAFLCNEGEAEYGEYKAFGKEYNKQPNGHPYYVAQFLRLFGVNETSAHLANNFAYLLGAASIFLLTFLIFGCERSALFAMAFYLLTPMVVVWSATAAAEPSSAAFGAFALAAAAVYAAAPSWRTVLLAAGALGFGVQFRPESTLLVLPFFAWILLRRPDEFFKARLYWIVALFMACASTVALHLYAVRNEKWGSPNEKFSWQVFWPNLSVNGPFYLTNVRYPVMFTVLALVGLLCAGRQFGSGRKYVRVITKVLVGLLFAVAFLFASMSFVTWAVSYNGEATDLWRYGVGIGVAGLMLSVLRKTTIPLLLWLAFGWAIFLFFYAGSYNYGADVRFSLIAAPPLAVLAGAGAGWLSSLNIGSMDRRRITQLLVLTIALSWLKFLPLVRMVGYEAEDARHDIDIAKEFATLVPPDSIVLAHTPSMWLFWGKNATQTSVATYNKHHVDADFFNRYKGGVYLHYGVWCNVSDPGQTQYCQNVLRDYKTDLIREHTVRGYRYALYRIYPQGQNPTNAN